jgi:hypothetical protein
MNTLTMAAVAVLIAAASGALGYGTGDSHGAARVQQQWDKASTQQAKAETKQATTTRTKESTHADQITAAVDTYQAARPAAAADAAERLARAERLQRTAEGRAAQYLAMSKAGDAERGRLADHAARLDASLADGRRVAEQLRATVVERDQQLHLLADVIRADRALAEPGAEPEP